MITVWSITTLLLNAHLATGLETAATLSDIHSFDSDLTARNCLLLTSTQLVRGAADKTQNIEENFHLLLDLFQLYEKYQKFDLTVFKTDYIACRSLTLCLALGSPININNKGRVELYPFPSQPNDHWLIIDSYLTRLEGHDVCRIGQDVRVGLTCSRSLTDWASANKYVPPDMTEVKPGDTYILLDRHQALKLFKVNQNHDIYFIAKMAPTGRLYFQLQAHLRSQLIVAMQKLSYFLPWFPASEHEECPQLLFNILMKYYDISSGANFNSTLIEKCNKLKMEFPETRSRRSVFSVFDSADTSYISQVAKLSNTNLENIQKIYENTQINHKNLENFEQYNKLLSENTTQAIFDTQNKVTLALSLPLVSNFQQNVKIAGANYIHFFQSDLLLIKFVMATLNKQIEDLLEILTQKKICRQTRANQPGTKYTVNCFSQQPVSLPSTKYLSLRFAEQSNALKFETVVFVDCLPTDGEIFIFNKQGMIQQGNFLVFNKTRVPINCILSGQDNTYSCQSFYVAITTENQPNRLDDFYFIARENKIFLTGPTEGELTLHGVPAVFSAVPLIVRPSGFPIAYGTKLYHQDDFSTESTSDEEKTLQLDFSQLFNSLTQLDIENAKDLNKNTWEFIIQDLTSLVNYSPATKGITFGGLAIIILIALALGITTLLCCCPALLTKCCHVFRCMKCCPAAAQYGPVNILPGPPPPPVPPRQA